VKLKTVKKIAKRRNLSFAFLRQYEAEVRKMRRRFQIKKCGHLSATDKLEESNA
jgi:hypothetical protein